MNIWGRSGLYFVFFVGVGMLIKPDLFHRLSLRSLQLQKRFFRGTHLERYAIYNLRYARENVELHRVLIRLLGVVLILFVLSMLRG